MRTAKFFVMAVTALGLVGGLSLFRAADDEPKYSIEEVMEKAHKAKKGQPSLFKKVVTGKASAEEKKQLVEYYEALAKNKPEKGSEADWKKRTTTILTAAKQVANGNDSARPQLARAVDCKACHQAHREE